MPATPDFDDYADQLKKLLDDARAAGQSGDSKKINDAFDALQDFIANSNSLLDGVHELDDIARHACNDLVIADVSGIAQRIADRTSDVTALVKKFSDQAATDHSTAAALRLEGVKAVTDGLTSTVSQIKKLVAVTDGSTADGAKFAAAAESAIDALNKLWTILPKIT